MCKNFFDYGYFFYFVYIMMVIVDVNVVYFGCIEICSFWYYLSIVIISVNLY